MARDVRVGRVIEDPQAGSTFDRKDEDRALLRRNRAGGNGASSPTVKQRTTASAEAAVGSTRPSPMNAAISGDTVTRSFCMLASPNTDLLFPIAGIRSTMQLSNSSRKSYLTG
jgi:hypothetical protein